MLWLVLLLLVCLWLLLLLLKLWAWLRIPAGVLRLHLPLLCPGQGSWGSRLRPVVARLLGQQLQSHHHMSRRSGDSAHTDFIETTQAACSCRC